MKALLKRLALIIFLMPFAAITINWEYEALSVLTNRELAFAFMFLQSIIMIITAMIFVIEGDNL